MKLLGIRTSNGEAIPVDHEDQGEIRPGIFRAVMRFDDKTVVSDCASSDQDKRIAQDNAFCLAAGVDISEGLEFEETDDSLTHAFRAQVLRLKTASVEGDPDAKRSLAAIVLLLDGWRPGEGGSVELVAITGGTGTAQYKKDLAA